MRHETLCYTELLTENAHCYHSPRDQTRRKSFQTEREARVFEATIVAKSVSGDVVDPRAGRITLATVYQSWLALRLDLSPKVRHGYEGIWRLRIEP